MFPARIGPAGADVARLLGALLGALLGDGDALPITGATRGRGDGREGGRGRSHHRGAPVVGRDGTGGGGRDAGLPGEPEDGAAPAAQSWKGGEELPGAPRQGMGM